MTSLANINPFLHNTMSLAVNPTMNSATSQDGRGTGGNSESIPGGEPVHCSIIVLPTSRILMSFHFQLSPRCCQRPWTWMFPRHFQAQSRQTCAWTSKAFPGYSHNLWYLYKAVHHSSSLIWKLGASLRNWRGEEIKPTLWVVLKAMTHAKCQGEFIQVPINWHLSLK